MDLTGLRSGTHEQVKLFNLAPQPRVTQVAWVLERIKAERLVHPHAQLPRVLLDPRRKVVQYARVDVRPAEAGVAPVEGLGASVEPLGPHVPLAVVRRDARVVGERERGRVEDAPWHLGHARLDGEAEAREHGPGRTDDAAQLVLNLTLALVGRDGRLPDQGGRLLLRQASELRLAGEYLANLKEKRRETCTMFEYHDRYTGKNTVYINNFTSHGNFPHFLARYVP